MLPQLIRRTRPSAEPPCVAKLCRNFGVQSMLSPTVLGGVGPLPTADGRATLSA